MTLPTATTTAHCEAILDEIERAVVGKRSALRLILTAVLARGHILIEDLPGLGKTLIARSFAAALGLKFTRVQFTPDLLPADLLGSTIYDMQSGRFAFRPGPIFTNLLLADEINRTPPKTQAALLEAMAERQVSIDGETHQLARPFIVLATDNPIEYEGTYPLPEAQLDRFILRSRIGYPSLEHERELLSQRIARAADEVEIAPVVDAQTLVEMQSSLELVHVSEPIVDYIARLVRATRDNPRVQVGASPRGGLALLKLSRGKAVLEGRVYVTPEDVKAVAVPALAHRLTLAPELWLQQIRGDEVVADLLEQVPTPASEDLGSAQVSD
ncbi:MoxR family ATPase [Gaiella sp.]|uniref:AAA family ATPase n=1 Tax=Gaiella sp. TaxID=2663207 RepID=UPI0032C20FEE